MEAFSLPECHQRADRVQLGPELDAALQACPVGVRNYSLISPEDYARLRERSLVDLSAVIDRFALHELQPLVDVLRDAQPKTYWPQHVTDAELLAVAQYVRSTAPAVLDRLSTIVRSAPDVQTPYEAFRDVVTSSHD